MRRPMRSLFAVLGAAVLVVAAGCTSTAPEDGDDGPAGSGTGQQSTFFVQADYDRQIAQRDTAPTGPADQPWLQAINPQPFDTTKYKKAGKHTICFSNAAVNNPWRVVGWTTMQAEAKLHPEIAALTAVDAEGKDDKQISDIDGLLASKKCSALIVSPNTTAALTPAVEKACQAGLPVIVFDRGVNTDCPVTFIHPVGGYAFGATAAEFLTGEVKKNGKILALRILPGVDVLETRWSAAKVIFDKADVDVVGVEFTDGDAAKVKTIVNDYLERYGSIDGVWMDAGATSVAAAEAFEDAGQKVPAITGEDQQDFLRLWQDKKLTAIAPTYPTYQWRTPIIAALDILNGKPVAKEWVLPQPTIASDNLSKYLLPQLPPLHYALCGCEQMPGFPQNWGGTQ
ncbi:substrate-binding domain-containing protein [Micromonospora sp. CPCC 205539]|uniref:substrate-binding domain-containing protein n=1 Tax=Micromonospora sp. CPCC 205539 TaxID=3122408 RepID=UPI002FF3EB65